MQLTSQDCLYFNKICQEAQNAVLEYSCKGFQPTGSLYSDTMSRIALMDLKEAINLILERSK